MKILLKYLFYIAVLVVIYRTNPPMNTHSLQLLHAQEVLDIPKNVDFFKDCEYHDFYLISVVSYQDDMISIGFVNNVLVQYKNLKEALEKYTQTNKGRRLELW